MTDTQVADGLLGALINGRYRVRERLARGELATVYVAQDERLERTVAVKLIHPGQAADPRFADQFVQEAQAVARLTHPNVVAAYDQGSHEGLPYLVTEFVRGRTLREILRSRRRLTVAEALAVTEQTLAAIAAAHRAGLVHRAVKPENVLVAQAPSGGTSNLLDSVVKVTDFGLAQTFQARETTGLGAGRPATAYLAPEVAAGGLADPRSDVYSAGIVLFEMLTGRLPDDQSPPAPSRYAAGLPPALDKLVVRATQPDPGARHTDAGALLTEVQAIRERGPATPPAVRPRPADATVVLSALPASEAPDAPGGGTDRPAWARLPSPRSNKPTSGAGRRGTTYEPRRSQPRRTSPVTTTLTRVLGKGDPAVARRRAVIGSFLAVAILLVGVGGWWVGFGRWVPAPALVGLPQAEAVALAQQQGLRVAYTDPTHDNQVAADHILRQDPTGRVARGGTLTLTLSLGPADFPIPDLIGSNVEVAIRQLESRGLIVLQAEPAYSNNVPADRVLTVEPPVGELVSAGDEITVTASKGRAPIDVPSLVGKQVDEAQQELTTLGLQAVVEEVDNGAPQGQVIGQDPPAGGGLEPGDRVTLQISKGPPTRPVPDVTGERCQRAARTLTDAGFTVEFVLAERGRVVFQNPSGGTGLPPGAQVTILCT